MPDAEHGGGASRDRDRHRDRDRRRWWSVPGLTAAIGRGTLPAVAMGLAFPPVGWWPLAIAWPALVAMAALRAPSRRAAFLGLWLPHAAAWLLLDTWLIDVAALGWPFLALYMGAWPALVGLLVRPARPGGPLARVPVALVLAVAWTGLEAIRGVYLFDGYPWYLLAQPLIEMPVLVQSASILGVYFTGFLVALVSGAAVDAALGLRRPAARGRLAAAAVGGLVGVAMLVHGLLAVADVDRGLEQGAAPPQRVVAVQTALPQDNKLAWPVEEQIDALRRWLGLAMDGIERSRAGGPGLPAREPDLVLFPETMIPGFGFEPEVRRVLAEIGDVRAAFPDALERLAADGGGVVLAGTTSVQGLEARPEGRGFRYVFGPRTNAVVAIDAEGVRDRYDKRFLTPFGETMPWLSSWPWLERQLLAFGAGGMSFDLEPGRGPRRLDVGPRDVPPGRTTVAAPICFEATVPGLVHELMHRDRPTHDLDPDFGVPSLIVNVSNDGWFGRSDAGRRRHAQMARFRAIEHRRPMVRSVNTGYSIVIDPAGRITARLGAGDYGTAGIEGALVADMPQEGRSVRTTYARLGPIWPPIALALLAVLAAGGSLGRASTTSGNAPAGPAKDTRDA